MMFAPRAMACSRSSRTRVAAPSPMMNPSRSRSNGRLACSGSSLRNDRAREDEKLAMATSTMPASVPPAIMTSAWLRRMISAASPMAFADAAHAVTVQVLGPKRLNSIETTPPAMFEMILAMASGETRSGPRWRSVSTDSWNVLIPPIPEPQTTPARRAAGSSSS